MTINSQFIYNLTVTKADKMHDYKKMSHEDHEYKIECKISFRFQNESDNAVTIETKIQKMYNMSE